MLKSLMFQLYPETLVSVAQRFLLDYFVFMAVDHLFYQTIIKPLPTSVQKDLAWLAQGWLQLGISCMYNWLFYTPYIQWALISLTALLTFWSLLTKSSSVIIYPKFSGLQNYQNNNASQMSSFMFTGGGKSPPCLGNCQRQALSKMRENNQPSPPQTPQPEPIKSIYQCAGSESGQSWETSGIMKGDHQQSMRIRKKKPRSRKDLSTEQEMSL